MSIDSDSDGKSTKLDGIDKARALAHKALLKLREMIEYLGMHPFAAGLLGLLGITGLILSVVSFQLDRQEALSSTDQVKGVEDKINHLSKELSIAAEIKSGVQKEAILQNKKNVWWGNWNKEDKPFEDGWITIERTTSTGVKFNIEAFSGARTGGLEGFAKFIGPNKAVFTEVVDWAGEKECTIELLKKNDQLLYLEVNATKGCSWFHGMGMSFDGAYLKEFDPLLEAQVFNEIELSEIHKAVGFNYRKLKEKFQSVNKYKLSKGDSGRAYYGSAQGMYKVWGGFVMIEDSGRVWAAFTEDKEIRVFSNKSIEPSTIPQSVRNWTIIFDDMRVVLE